MTTDATTPEAPAETPAPAKPPIHIVVGLPTGDTMEAGFGYDLSRMFLHLGATVCAQGALEMRAFMVQDSLIHEARNEIVETMLRKTDATHLLFLDSDMRFPWQLPLQLLYHAKPIIGVNYSTRAGMPRPTALLDETVEEEGPRRYLYPPVDPAEAGEPVEVEAVGMGVCLIERQVLEAVGYPWFEAVYDPVNRRRRGEDVDFCRKAKAKGFGTWVDPLASEAVGHVGRFEYRLRHITAVSAPKLETPPAPRIVLP